MQLMITDERKCVNDQKKSHFTTLQVHFLARKLKYLKEFVLEILFLAFKSREKSFVIFQLIFFFEKTQSSDFHYDFFGEFTGARHRKKK